MKKNFKYKLILGITIGIYILFELLKPKPTDWSITLAPNDKIPFGTFVFHQLLPDLFSEGNLVISEESIYQAYTQDSTQNLIIIGKAFYPGESELNMLIRAINAGTNCLLISDDINYELRDTLNLFLDIRFFADEQLLQRRDSTAIIFKDKAYDFPEAFVGSTIDARDDDFTELATDRYGNPVFVEKQIGKGKLLWCSAPLLISNYSLLSGDNTEMMEHIVNYLPDRRTTLTSLYLNGRTIAPQNRMRFILSTPALRWAWFIALGALFLFMLLGLKREQRQIPTIKPPRNSTIDFAETVGQLYLKTGDHKDIVDKRLTFLKEHFKSKYFMRINFDETEIEKVINKTGKDAKVIKAMYHAIAGVSSARTITSEQLIQFNQKIEDFYYN
ncbi:MAG: DUF4350 domain-containing protein [Bacteroidota bacterium]